MCLNTSDQSSVRSKPNRLYKIPYFLQQENGYYIGRTISNTHTPLVPTETYFITRVIFSFFCAPTHRAIIISYHELTDRLTRLSRNIPIAVSPLRRPNVPTSYYRWWAIIICATVSIIIRAQQYTRYRDGRGSERVKK